MGPTSEDMYGLMTAGCLMTFCYGRYDFYPAENWLPQRWVRDGGHCVTLNAVLNGCSNNAAIGFRNPSSSDSDTAQSPFQTAYFPVRQIVALFAGEPNVFPTGKLYTILDEVFDDGRLRVIDGMAVIWPTEGLSVDATQGILSAQKFIDLNLGITNGTNPTHIGLLLPAVQKIREAAARVHRHPALPIAVVTLDGETGGADQPGLWTCNLGTREWLRVAPVPQGGGCFGPDGRYFFGVANAIRGIDPANPTHAHIECATRGHTLLACGTTDPMTDGNQFDYELISITRTTGGGLFVASGDVDGDGCSPHVPEPFPSSIAIPQGCEIGVSPIDGSFVLAREGFSGLVRCGRPAGGGGWVVLESIATPGCSRPRAPHFTKSGELIFTCDGTVRVMERNPANGQWQPKTSSKWNGLRGGTGFELGRGRDGLSDWANTRLDTNLDPDVESRIVEGRTVVDCPADFNNDGFVDFFDYDAYVSCFEGVVESCPANNPVVMSLDMNGDGFIDFFDYDAFVAIFERGC